MKCEPPPSIASSFADSVSISAPSVAVNSSRKRRRMRARPFSNASRYTYEYIVGGKSAVDWVVERQCVKTDKDSGIVNDANDWANETMENPRYPLELLQRVITVSLETMKIVRSLPKLDILSSY